MRIKIITLLLNGQQVQFAEHEEKIVDEKAYSLLIPKILYLEMMQSIVDNKILQDSIQVYQKVMNNDKLLYVKVDEKTREKVLWAGG